MKKIIILNKKEGKTPLETLEFFRQKHKKYKNISLTYAGRLDPMASGVLVILAGEETKNKDKYLALEKEYEFEILFGVSTDTYDILGKIKAFENKIFLKEKIIKNIKNNLKYFVGRFKQEYPLYSSKTVSGKPLFVYARAGEEPEIPSKEVSVRNLKFIKIRKVSKLKLLNKIKSRIKKVQGDFRQKEIIKIWQEKIISNEQDNFFIASFKIKCSSGTYVRGIADSLGEKMHIPALAFSIKRTKVGKYVILKR